MSRSPSEPLKLLNYWFILVFHLFKTILFILENQYVPDEDIENISGKIESFSLSGVLETSLDYIQGMEGMQPPVQEPRKAGKRGKEEANLESGSNLIPREMRRMGSEQLNTPNCSDQINSNNINGYLRNCPQVNDLGWDCPLKFIFSVTLHNIFLPETQIKH